jgi:nucleoside-diphosphate-sugar epimerase
LKTEIILVTGACGQIGTELTGLLREKYGYAAVFAADIQAPITPLKEKEYCLELDVRDKDMLQRIVSSFRVTQIYHLAAVLSASGEQDPQHTWQVNMEGLLNVLEVAREEQVSKVFWPSSIAVFGANTMRAACPQHTVTQPATSYGISKCAGEQWCNYYFEKYGLDVRSIRFPGLISHMAKPGGGTTDYAVDIFQRALTTLHYTSYLNKTTCLPFMYMPDAIKATLELTEAPAERLTVRTAYNLAGMSFTPAELAAEIKKHLPRFKIKYRPDFRQQIADGWPSSIDDRHARHDWGWQPEYDLQSMVKDMIHHIVLKINGWESVHDG